MMLSGQVTCTIRQMLDIEKSTCIKGGVEVSLVPELREALDALVQTVEQFAAEHFLAGDVLFRLNLVLDELVTNSVNYALPEVANPELHMRLAHTPEAVVVELEDNGAAFNPFRDAPKPDTDQALEDRPVGGLGVFLVTEFADSASYEREAGVNRVTLQIKLET